MTTMMGRCHTKKIYLLLEFEWQHLTLLVGKKVTIFGSSFFILSKRAFYPTLN